MPSRFWIRSALQKITVIGTLLKVSPIPSFSPPSPTSVFKTTRLCATFESGCVRSSVIGSLNAKFNGQHGNHYDITNGCAANQVIQVNYNGGCCGIALNIAASYPARFARRTNSAWRSSSPTSARSGTCGARKKSFSSRTVSPRPLCLCVKFFPGMTKRDLHFSFYSELSRLFRTRKLSPVS